VSLLEYVLGCRGFSDCEVLAPREVRVEVLQHLSGEVKWR